MPSTEPDELPRRRTDGQLLENIYSEGERRRRRRRQVGSVGLSAAVVTVMAVGVLVARLQGGDPQHVATRGPTAPTALGSTTSPSPPPAAAVVTSTTATGTVTLPGSATGSATTARPSTTTVATTTTVPPATTTTRVCRNSNDPACGEFRWDPDPGPNAPLVIDVGTTPRAGAPRTVDFAVAYSDADADDFSCRIVFYGDDEGVGQLVEGGPGVCPVLSCLAPFGPWTPPARTPGRAQVTVTHTYAKAGTYTVRFTARSDYGCLHPYSSTGEKTVTVTVP